jgi:hypothetical protein
MNENTTLENPITVPGGALLPFLIASLPTPGDKIVRGAKLPKEEQEELIRHRADRKKKNKLANVSRKKNRR